MVGASGRWSHGMLPKDTQVWPQPRRAEVYRPDFLRGGVALTSTAQCGQIQLLAMSSGTSVTSPWANRWPPWRSWTLPVTLTFTMRRLAARYAGDDWAWSQAYLARPKATPTGTPLHTGAYRIRHDRIDSDGKLTLRHNSRLHHLGMRRRYAGTNVLLLIHDLHIRVLTTDGRLLRELQLDPTKDYQPQTRP